MYFTGETLTVVTFPAMRLMPKTYAVLPLEPYAFCLVSCALYLVSCTFRPLCLFPVFLVASLPLCLLFLPHSAHKRICFTGQTGFNPAGISSFKYGIAFYFDGKVVPAKTFGGIHVD